MWLGYENIVATHLRGLRAQKVVMIYLILNIENEKRKEQREKEKEKLIKTNKKFSFLFICCYRTII